MTSLLRELFDAVRRAPDHRAPSGHHLRTATVAEVDTAIAVSGLPPCGDADCACGSERLIYRPRRES